MKTSSPRSKSVQSYTECEEYFARASESAHGIRLAIAGKGQAVRLRAKMHKYRVLLRERSRDVYTSEDPKHGTCPYDHLVISLVEENDVKAYLDIKPFKIDIESVQDLEPKFIGG